MKSLEGKVQMRVVVARAEIDRRAQPRVGCWQT
jgi:hypothetical protein